MSMFNQLSDNELAVLGCLGALLASVAVMTISHHVGRLVQGDERRRADALPLPTPEVRGKEPARRAA
jgi:hypothetical protein